MTYPKIYLAFDNCFAVKRWLKPSEWAKIIADAGVNRVEISADCECDPIFSDKEYLAEWLEDAREACAANSVAVSSLYSGHGSYNTAGLAHPDRRVGDNLIRNWILPYAAMAAKLDAGLGFYMQAFPVEIMRSAVEYGRAYQALTDVTREIAAQTREKGVRFTAVEQMYSPQQTPWTINGAVDFMKRTGAYITIDTGHASGQRKFLRPYAQKAAGGENDSYLFASPEDCDIYSWLASLALYSPIIHLQQTDGLGSPHHPFTDKYNRRGIIEPEKLLRAIKASYDKHVSAPLCFAFPPCGEINLTFELFFGLTDTPNEILSAISESVSFWRRFIPRDGVALDRLL